MAENTNYLDVINFTNIDNSDFEGMWGGEKVLIKAGETRQFPRFLANHYAKHLIDKILIKGGSDYSNELLRKPLADRIFGEVFVPSEAVSSTLSSEFQEMPKEEKTPEPTETSQVEEKPKIEEKKKKRGRPPKS